MDVVDDEAFEAELERRLDLLETAGSGESVLPALPARDVWFAALGILVMSVLLTWWGYPA